MNDGDRDAGWGFDDAVPDGGYAWWYVDALSDDGLHGITLIAFIGSVFSPYYAWDRRRGRPDPTRHCALNVALYGRAKRWAMTERGSASLRQSTGGLAIGPSSVVWDGTALTFTITERTAPFAGHIAGTVTVRPRALTGRHFALDAAGLHRWAPMAPRCDVDVALRRPDLRWSGAGYCDRNFGATPLENSFTGWAWSRATLGEDTVVFYDVDPLHGSTPGLSLRIGRDGAMNEYPQPPPAPLPRSRWGMARLTRSHGAASVQKTLEDTPFYARSLVTQTLSGAPAVAVHESLSLTRFRTPWVQAMLPFRMPRAG